MTKWHNEYIFLIGFVLLILLLLGIRNLPSINNGEQAAEQAQSGESGNAQAVSLNDGDQLHVVQAGETLNGIAAQYGVPISSLVTANNIANPDLVEVGQALIIPAAGAAQRTSGNDLALLPDGELVYGPGLRGWDVTQVVSPESYLGQYRETVEGVSLSGPEIVQLVADRLSVSPRLLIAMLEYRSEWVTLASVNDDGYPMHYRVAGFEGLYTQLEWAANRLNRGFYGRTEVGLDAIVLSDGTAVSVSAALNPGTVGVQNWLAGHGGVSQTSWAAESGTDGFIATYQDLFGDPFQFDTGEPLLPQNLAQPTLGLPWSDDETWYFTGGPHGGWASGSAWAALDFVPPGAQLGCYQSADWVRAVADGVVVRSNFGAVMLDLDGDGYAGTGWNILYQHIATQDRAAVGTRVKRGDPIGHPSCEGGVSTGTHLHIARLYNGRWVSADQAPSFNLDGWSAQGSGTEYNGTLGRNGDTKVATIGRVENNAISAEP